jgi:uncharacterized protein YodC (DUF2158 family)
MDFEKGDVVRMKSGGPKMTVTRCTVDATGKHLIRLVDTTWFDAAGHIQSTVNSFPAELLEKEN